MLYIGVIAVAVIILAARWIDRFVAGMHDPSACNQNCRQGRDCDCEERA